MRSVHGGLLVPRSHTERDGCPPRSVTGPESLAATCATSTFGADVWHPLSRVASPERYVGLRVSGENCSSGVPSSCVLQGLWRSGSIGVFSCAPILRHRRARVVPGRRLFGLFSNRPQRGTHEDRDEL